MAQMEAWHEYLSISFMMKTNEKEMALVKESPERCREEWEVERKQSRTPPLSTF